MNVHVDPAKAVKAAQELLRRRDVRRKSERLHGFMHEFWHVLEPGVQFKTGWAIEAMCDHLEAVTRGDITRLIINVPPGMSKSLMTAVFWPAWEWTTQPHMRVLSTAYKTELAERDSKKFGTLVTSPFFRTVYGHIFRTTKATTTDVENDHRGFRKAMAFQSLTGSRGNRVIIDDPLSVDQAKSATELRNVADTFTEAVPSRLNDPEKDAIVMIMQRLHTQDPSGLALEHDLGYEHLMLPMEFEPDRKCYTSIGFEDPRKEEGELLFPERFTPEVVMRDKHAMSSVNGSYAVAGQYQQRPAPRGGGMFKLEWFKFLPTKPPMRKMVRGWDFAATEDASAARTAAVGMGIDEEGRFVIWDVTKDRLSPAGVEKLLHTISHLDGRTVKGVIPKDPGQAGKMQVEHWLKTALAGFTYHAEPQTGSKEVRAEPLAAQFEVGNVYLVEGPWNKEFIDECTIFPAGKFKDQVDAAASAFTALTTKPKSMLQSL